MYISTNYSSNDEWEERHLVYDMAGGPSESVVRLWVNGDGEWFYIKNIHKEELLPEELFEI